MIAWLIGGGVLLALASKRDADYGGSSKPTKASPNLQALRGEAARAGVSDDWATFLGAVAHHESRWVISAHNGSASEVSASASAYDRNAEKLSECKHPRSAYVIGSGGWYGFLPANGIVSAFRGTPGICIDPATIYDPWISTLMAIAYAKNLQGWGSFKRSDRTWLELNRGWSVPGKMDIARPKSDERFLKGLRAQGVPESFASKKVGALPQGWHAWSRLQLEGAPQV